MPPKKRGQNVRGRDKIFRNAVQHVHVGVGHNVLGNISLHPVVGPGDISEDECSFQLVLNEQMLSHSTTDFKQFRWEVHGLCESKALFHLNHRKIAEKLLLCLMRRDRFAEGYEAFLHLTVAFARDMGEKFFTYFECFHQAVNGGILDAKGQLLADTRRLQLVFSVQAAWCREMRPYWLLQEQRKLVERVIRLYVRQMHNTKEYIRRLSAEVLASVCRMVRDLVPLVVEVVCMNVVRDFDAYCAAAVNDNSRNDGLEEEEEEEEEEETEEAEAPRGDDDADDGDGRDVAVKSMLQTMAPTQLLLHKYERDRLNFLPVVDGMCFLTAEMFRGIRGALSTNLENHYVLFMYAFGLTRVTQFAGRCCTGYGDNEEEMFGFSDEEAKHLLHSSEWEEVIDFAAVGVRETGKPTTSLGSASQQRCMLLQQLVQLIGSAVIGRGLRVVAEEATSAIPADGGVRRSSLQLLLPVTALLEFSLPHARLLLSVLHAADLFFLRDPETLRVLKDVLGTLLEELVQQRKVISAQKFSTEATDDWCRLMRTCGAFMEVAMPLCIDSDELPAHAVSVVAAQRLFLPLCREILVTCMSVASSPSENSASVLQLRDGAKKLMFAFAQDALQKNYALCLRQERRNDEEDVGACDGKRTVKSHLTPFAVELLAYVLHGACTLANKGICLINNDAPKRVSQLAYRDVTLAVMFARMMSDRTANTEGNPLLAVLTTTPSHVVDRSALVVGLQDLLLGVTTAFADMQKQAADDLGSNTSNWADVVIAVLPLVPSLVDAEAVVLRASDGRNAATQERVLFASRFQEVLLRVMRTVRASVCSKGAATASSSHLTAASYSLFAQASALLAQLAAHDGGDGSSDEAQSECVAFLRDAVTVLATSFRNEHMKEMGDEEMGRLLHGMECLLMSLLRLLGVELERDAETATSAVKREEKKKTKKGHAGSLPHASNAGADDGRGDNDNKEVQKQQQLMNATRRLRGALDAEAQHALVQTLLFEALASHSHSLRVVALRLLRLLCHPNVDDTERIAGCSAIDPLFFGALLRAELFNPLSATGNLDGVQQALAKLSFDAAAYNLCHPLQRVVLARAMMGLLHTKYADAWPIALNILTDLVRAEDTTLPKQAQQDAYAAPASSSLAKFEPLVWRSVVCHYARTVVFGDIVSGGAALHVSHREAGDDDDDDFYDSADIPVWYWIRLTDMQRHEKGELVSKDFFTAQDAGSLITLLQLANKEGEVLSWHRHYLPAASPTYIRGTATARSNDRAVVAKTFLSGLLEMVRGASLAAGDGRASLAAELVLELAAVRSGEHPGGLRKLRMLDERLVLALNACSVTTTATTTTTLENVRLPEDVKTKIVACSERLQRVCVGLISDANVKLQHAAIDQLRRLKVKPFARYHAQLIPYCDTQQNLFHFLGTFHLESDIPQEDIVDYIATALAIALPKLTAKVSKEKMKDKAILQRRVLSFVNHLKADGEFAAVLEGLVQRLIFERVIPVGTMDLAAFRFYEQWSEWVKSESHCVRRLEKHLKQVLSTSQLLSVLMQAVGRRFAPFAGSCLHLALNTYLIACKHVLRVPLSNEASEGDASASAREMEPWRRINSALSSATFNTLLPRLRRTASALVASLCEQFPVEVMAALQEDISRSPVSTSAVKPYGLMGRYIEAMQLNSHGAMPELCGLSSSAKGSGSAVTIPLLRLVRAWVASPVTMPLVGAFGNEVTTMFRQVFSLGGSLGSTGEARASLRNASTLSMYEGLRCVAAILSAGDEVIDVLGAAGHATLRAQYIEPHVIEIFSAIYRLIVRGGSPSTSSHATTATREKRQRQQVSPMAFSLSMWKEMIATVVLLAEYIVDDRDICKADDSSAAPTEGVDAMLSRLLTMCITFVAHPTCGKDRQTCNTAVTVLESLLPRMRRVEFGSHYEPLVRLFNVVTSPEARQSLCRALPLASERLVYADCPGTLADQVKRGTFSHTAQLAAIGRAVSCLNWFADDNTSLDRYDFEVRFHTLRSLERFFKDGNNESGAHPAMYTPTNPRNMAENVRRERDYNGKLDVTIPLHPEDAPVLCVEGFLALAANVVFFLREPEGTIRALAAQLLDAMLLYASRQNARVLAYDTLILERVVRREVLPSLRRGVVSRDAHIRHTHMQCFGALAQCNPTAFSSFTALYSRNIEQNFFANVGHIQHRCRLNALAHLRQRVGRLLPRDVLRVFVPFLLALVKDLAQGKRDLQNLTEGRAKGYCDAVLMTIATLASALPWVGYHRVLSLLLLNARENSSLRLPMLHGVVMVLEHFHFLDGVDDGDEGEEKKNVASSQTQNCGTSSCVAAAVVGNGDNDNYDDDDDDDDDDKSEEDAVLHAKRLKYRNARILHVLEEDVLPQLYEFLDDGSRKGRHPLGAELRGNAHTVTNVRGEMRKADNAQQNTAILQLPVAIAITKIVKRFPHDRFSSHAEHLLDEVALKLRTKNDKHRERARRVLSAMLCETGPGKLSFVITKLRDHFMHGYQLHVLGYTVVTLLYNLYEPQHAISYGRRQAKNAVGAAAANGNVTYNDNDDGANNNDDDDDNNNNNNNDNGRRQRKEPKTEEEKEEAEEMELIRQLVPASARFDHAYGVSCLTACLDDLMTILLDDYLGEVGEQKEQVELMSTMVEVKSNRALQGFSLIASHCQADRVITTFLQKITWLLTPPSDATNVDVHALRGSARAAALLLHEVKTKYSTISKNAMADFAFVHKVRLLAVRVARALMKNATMEVEGSFCTVRGLLQRHNEVRKAKVEAFEAKDGTRRVRGNVHLTIQRAPAATRREQLEANFLIAPQPERIDVDFSAHTVLATQQKQKLRAYRGRYGKELQQAAKDFYREDPTTAVVLDTLDEFLLKYMLSVLKQVLGIGKERKYTKAAVRLDLLRTRRHNRQGVEGDDTEDDDAAEKVGEVEHQKDEENDSMDASAADGDDDDDNGEEGGLEDVLLEPHVLNDEEDDALGRFAAKAQRRDENERDTNGCASWNQGGNLMKNKKQPMADLTASFTRQHQQLLESLVPVVLETLQGEGSDAVVGHALDCLLALVSLRPPLRAVGTLHARLYETVIAFVERGGAIKQRAMRVAAAVVSHQRFVLSDERAVQLTRLCHEELVDRNEFAPMALSLFYAVLGKHVHVVEVYELIGVVTELLLHMSAKRLMRQRCIAVLTRFLTEYRMTPEKFRSHVDLLCRNLDYPDVTGRIAILELLGALVYRMPTEVLRHEAPFLLLPLSVTLATSEFQQARQKAADVLHSLVRNAGVDVLVPTLSAWLAPHQSCGRKAIALQAWALMIPAVATAYDMQNAEEVRGFEACCTWSLPAVSAAATYDQLATSGMDCRRESVATAVKQKMEMKNWTCIFFALRCVEAMATAAPVWVWQNTAFTAQLVQCLSNRLVLHSHPWIQGAALRLLRMYCHDGVEQRCMYLTYTHWAQVELTSAVKMMKRTEKRVGHAKSAPSASAVGAAEAAHHLPYVLCFHPPGPVDTIARAVEVLEEMSSALQTLLQYIGLSDVPNEKYSAHRAMQQPARSDAVGVALYLTRAMVFVSVTLLVVTSRMGETMGHVQGVIARHFASLCRQLHALATPVIKHESVSNVMVRTMSLVQYFGGFLSAFHVVDDGDAAVDSALRWLLSAAVSLSFVQQTMVPVITVAMRCGNRSEKLSALAAQGAMMLREQLEACRCYFKSDMAPEADVGRKGRKKRSRVDEKQWQPMEREGNGGVVVVDDVLFLLATGVAAVKNTRKDEATKRETTKTLRKRSRNPDASCDWQRR